MYKKDLILQRTWVKLLSQIGEMVGKRPKDLNSLLFLIGVQELGQGQRNFSKEEKQDLMHIAIWKPARQLPHFDLLEQEKLLKMHILEYFEKEYGFVF